MRYGSVLDDGRRQDIRRQKKRNWAIQEGS
jgi:hypothetical protein